MSDGSETYPPYLCQSFGVTNPENEPLMQEWLNTHARRGYRLFDRQMFGGGVSMVSVHQTAS